MTTDRRPLTLTIKDFSSHILPLRPPVLVYRQHLKGRRYEVEMVWDVQGQRWVSPRPVRFVVEVRGYDENRHRPGRMD